MTFITAWHTTITLHYHYPITLHYLALPRITSHYLALPRITSHCNINRVTPTDTLTHDTPHTTTRLHNRRVRRSCSTNVQRRTHVGRQTVEQAVEGLNVII